MIASNIRELISKIVTIAGKRARPDYHAAVLRDLVDMGVMIERYNARFPDAATIGDFAGYCGQWVYVEQERYPLDECRLFIFREKLRRIEFTGDADGGVLTLHFTNPGDGYSGHVNVPLAAFHKIPVM